MYSVQLRRPEIIPLSFPYLHLHDGHQKTGAIPSLIRHQHQEGSTGEQRTLLVNIDYTMTLYNQDADE